MIHQDNLEIMSVKQIANKDEDFQGKLVLNKPKEHLAEIALL